MGKILEVDDHSQIHHTIVTPLSQALPFSQVGSVKVTLLSCQQAGHLQSKFQIEFWWVCGWVWGGGDLPHQAANKLLPTEDPRGRGGDLVPKTPQKAGRSCGSPVRAGAGRGSLQIRPGFQRRQQGPHPQCQQQNLQLQVDPVAGSESCLLSPHLPPVHHKFGVTSHL